MYCGRSSDIVSQRMCFTPASTSVVIASSTDCGKLSTNSLYPTSTITVGAMLGPSVWTTSTSVGGW